MTQATVRTPEKEAAVLNEIRVSGNVSAACRKAKVSRFTWYQWINDTPELREAHQAAFVTGRENRADRAEDKLAELVEKGDTTATIFTLKTLRRDIYGDRSITELTGPNGAPLTITLAERPDGPA
jgi:transposase